MPIFRRDSSCLLNFGFVELEIELIIHVEMHLKWQVGPVVCPSFHVAFALAEVSVRQRGFTGVAYAGT